MSKNILHARTSPNVLARQHTHISYLRHLDKIGGLGAISRRKVENKDAVSKHISWRWLKNRGYVCGDNKNWWITPRGRFTLECWGK